MYFPNVNFLRAAAALLVLVYHVVELGPWPAFPTDGVFLLFRVGWVGVDLFFVISGFVIGLSAIRLYRDGDRYYRWTFMRRRLARIVPLYLVTCIAFLVLVRPPFLQLSWEKIAVQIGSHLLFLHNLHPWLHGAINGAELERGGGNAVLRARDRGGAAPVAAGLALASGGRRARRVGSRALAFWGTRDLGNPSRDVRLRDAGSGHAR